MHQWKSISISNLVLLWILMFGGVGAIDLGGLFGAGLGAAKNLSCPQDCVCQQSSVSQFFKEYFEGNAEKMGEGSRSDTAGVVSAVLAAMKSNFFLQLIFQSKLLTDMTCDVMDNTTSLDTRLAQVPGFLALVTFRCGANVAVDFDAYPTTILLLSLKIHGCSLSSNTVPFVFPRFNVLMVLELNNVNVDWLNTLDIAHLDNLQALAITNHTMNKLPTIWTNASLASLSLLDLSQNGLREFHCEIGWGTRTLFMTLPTIDTINLQDNLLTEIPRCLLENRQVIPYISIAGNNITNTSVFQEAPGFIRVRELNLRHNQIGSIHLFTFSNMLRLDLSHNHLKSLGVDSFRPETMVDVLNVLDLSHNQLEYIEYGSLGFSPSLRFLNLSHNRLTAFSLEFSPVYNKNVTIDVRGNSLKYPPFANTGYMGPPAVKMLASGNTFQCDCSMVKFVAIHQQLVTSWDSADRRGFLSPYRAFSDAHEYRCHEPSYLRGASVTQLGVDGESCPVVESCPPACVCERRNRSVRVDCHRRNLTRLPDVLPDGWDLRVNLSGNELPAVNYRPYFKRIVELDLSHNRIGNVSASSIMALLGIAEVRLHSNALTQLPASMETAQDSSTVSLTLAGNPWTCSCDTLWMKSWLIRMGSRVPDAGAVLCRGGAFTGEKLRDIAEGTLNCHPVTHVATSAALGTLLGLFLILALVVYWKRRELKILLYANMKWDCLKADSPDQDLPYDVFVSFSQHDYKWVVHTLTPALEQRHPPYKLCLHQRDFPVGEPIAESIARAIEDSRCTVMLVTKNFVDSEWCMYEFQTAHQSLMSKDCQVVLLLQDKLETRGLDKTLAAYIKTHTYIKMKDRLFWEKLLYALPKPRDVR